MITISLVKNFKKHCEYPCLIMFTDVSGKNQHHYLHTSNNIAITKFIDTFNNWYMQHINDNPTYTYSLNESLKEIMSEQNVEDDDASYRWKELIKQGWRPLDRNKK
jgi:hypothetical protein